MSFLMEYVRFKLIHIERKKALITDIKDSTHMQVLGETVGELFSIARYVSVTFTRQF